jgi:nitrite reductase (NADH) large subunit
MIKQKLLIIGLGMAAARLLDELVKRQAQQRYEIVVFGDESHGGYNRIQLSHVLSGESTLDDITSHDAAWFAMHDITWFSGKKIASLYADSKYVVDVTGECYDYDTLVLATGSLPVMVDVAGNNLSGVMSFRDVFDVQRMLSLSPNNGRIVVVGAGLLGLEAAYGLVKQGFEVTVVHRSNRVMSQQLDVAAGALLQTHLESMGMQFVLSSQVASIFGIDSVEAVRLSTGETLAAQAVVMAIGIRPNAGLAKTAGLIVNRGVIVDGQCRTSVDDVYAVGECSEFDGQTYGLVAPIYRQVSVLVGQLMSEAVDDFRNLSTATQLKVSGVTLYAFGDPMGQSDTQALVYEDGAKGVYRKVMLSPQGCVTGAVLLGNINQAQTIFNQYQQAIPVSVAQRAELVFGQ